MDIALDFDNTLTIGQNFPETGLPRLWLIERAKQWKDDGHRLIMWTCREDVYPDDLACFSPRLYLTEAVAFCKMFGLEFDAVNCGITEAQHPEMRFSRKIFADLYIDDKSVSFNDENETFQFNSLTAYGNIL